MERALEVIHLLIFVGCGMFLQWLIVEAKSKRRKMR